MKLDLHRSLLAVIAATASPCLLAQIATPEVFNNPGQHTYQVPAQVNQLRVVVAGAAGGAGGWDDALGGAGAGGTIVTALIAVQGGETVSIVVAEGGEGSLGTPKINPNKGAAGGGDGTRQTADSLQAAIPGAGGKGGDIGSVGSSPGGAGGGGASALFVAGAAVVAGGGGGGGSNSRIAINDSWNIAGKDAENTLALRIEDATCSALASGRPGEAANATAKGTTDGAGGSGGGGGYGIHVGAGGAGGKDGRVIRGGYNPEPGESGGSCTLSAGRYKVSDATAALGEPTPPGPTKGPTQPDGANGYVHITALITPVIVPQPPAAATPVPTLGTLGLISLASAIGAAGMAMARRRQSPVQ